MEIETKINPNIVARARPHLFNAGMYLKPYSWINVRKLAENVNITPTIAGCVLTTLGWKKNNQSGGSSARTYRR